jgi:hypothetical protein
LARIAYAEVVSLFKRRAAKGVPSAEPVTRTIVGIDPDNPPLRLVGWGRPNSRYRKKERQLFREAWERTGQLLGERPAGGTNEGTDRQPSQGMPSDQAEEGDDGAEGDHASAEAESIHAEAEARRAAAFAEAEHVLAGARAEGEDIRAKARAEAMQMQRFVADSVAEAARIRADARAEAERMKEVVIALATYARIASSQEKTASDDIVISVEDQVDAGAETRYHRTAGFLNQLSILASKEEVTDEMLNELLDSERSEEAAAVEEREQEPAARPQE